MRQKQTTRSHTKNDHLFFGFAGLSGLVPGAKAASAHEKKGTVCVSERPCEVQ